MPVPHPDKPSIAVPPFDNNSSVPEQEQFADGIAQGGLTASSHSLSLLVAGELAIGCAEVPAVCGKLEFVERRMY